MEVHTPKAAPRSWRAFLREYVVIVIGVLTALGAEQSVAWLHRYQTRRQLENDLREEMRINDATLRDDLKYVGALGDWTFQEAQRMQAAAKANNIESLRGHKLQNPAAGKIFSLPNDSVWQHAKESGTVALLPREEAEAYTTFFRIRDRLLDVYSMARSAAYDLSILRARLSGSRTDWPELSNLSAPQLDELASALLRVGISNDYVKGYVSAMLPLQKLLASGSTSQDELINAFKRDYNAARPPPSPTPSASPAADGKP